MSNRENLKRTLRMGTAASLMFAMSAVHGATLVAQDGADADADDEEDLEEVIVTGSKLKKNNFTSISPLQVIDGEVSRDLGLFDATAVLQQATQTTGLQIDNTFNNFVLNNGNGATTLSFRGLGPDRTLVLINGRRFAPAGVGGGPSAPDINLIPSVLVQRYENLFDGAAAIYGSDAVAGVSNVILRDVVGIEGEVSYSVPEAGGGQELTVGVVYGDEGDRWKFQVAAEYYERKAQSFAQSDFFIGCDEYLFEDENGNILTQNRSATSGNVIPGHGSTSCPTRAVNRFIAGEFIFGSLYSTPGSSNVGIPGWSETVISNFYTGFIDPAFNFVQYDSNLDGVIDTNDFAFGDANADGAIDIRFTDPKYNYNLTDEVLSGDLLAGFDRKTIYSTGEYILDEDSDATAYAEFMYTERDSRTFSPGASIFPVVPATNPFNPVGVNGVDAWTAVSCCSFGPTTAQPVLVVKGDKEPQDAVVEQIRGVLGFRGNIPGMDSFLGGNWSYDVYGSYSRSEGNESYPGIRGDRLNLSLTTTIEDPDNPGNFICGVDEDLDGIPDGTDGCVPVNLFADSLYQEGGGAFASQAEADYLFDDRIFKTVIEQTIVSATTQGDLFTLPWNDQAVPMLFGFEYRKDKINSIGNDVAEEGLIENWFSDRGAVGSREFFEGFVETSVTLLQDTAGIQAFTIDGSARVTDESNFKPAFTYSLKGGLVINDYLTFKGTYGTSFRAPNLRERFLRGTSGFNTISDPCTVPDAARVGVPVGGTIVENYNAAGDERFANVISACQGDGLDPFSLGLDDGTGNGFDALQGVEITTGGSTDAFEETSTSYTLGAVVRQPISDAFDLTFSMTYFNINITGGVLAPSNAFIVNQCYDNPDSPNGDSPFCGLITRQADGQISNLNRRFLNAGVETSKGIDFNLLYQQDFDFGGDEVLNVTVDARATKATEVFSDLLGVTDDDVGEVQTPRWRGQTTIFADYGKFGMSWNVRFIGSGVADSPTPFGFYTPCPSGLGVQCRPISATDDYFVHSASVTYRMNENLTLNAGVRNVFNNEPPKVDSTDVFSVNLNPIGVGYDTVGRTFYASIRAKM